MKATIKEFRSNALQPDNKEMISCYDVVAKCADYSGKVRLRSLVTARFYMGRSSSASVVYCCLWVHGGFRDKTGKYVECHTSGRGQAGGYGYHKTSAALADAIKSAGIELYGDQYGKDNSRSRNKKPAYIGGCGDGALTDALLAIARAAGAKGELLVIRN